MATLQLPAMGYGLRYEYGIFRQTIKDGWQNEQPDNWLRRPDPWEVPRPARPVEVELGCTFEMHQGEPADRRRPAIDLIGIPFDRPVVGLRRQDDQHAFGFGARRRRTPSISSEFSSGDFVGALVGGVAAESLTRVLYPDDSTAMGQGLRFIQEYFLVACSLADLVRRFRRDNHDWSLLPDKVAIQLNDTHPAMAVPELMRILLDEAKLDWEQAWDITQRTLAYTNHTLLPEALEKWPLRWFERCCRATWRSSTKSIDASSSEVRRAFPATRPASKRQPDRGRAATDKVRMANLAIVGSHSTNGVAAIHSELLRKTTVQDLAEIFPERFNNKTNGVTPRRWLLLANPALASAITKAIGDGWITDLTELASSKPAPKTKGFADVLPGQAGGQGAVRRLAEERPRARSWIPTVFSTARSSASTNTSGNCSTRCGSSCCTTGCAEPESGHGPATFFFAGKAAPAYHLAKLIIKLINNLAGTIDSDPAVRGRIKVVFVPDYCVSWRNG